MKNIWMRSFAVLAILSITGTCGLAEPGNEGAMIPGGTASGTPTGTGFYDIRCNIEGATVYLDDNMIGTITDGSLIISVPVYDQPHKRLLRLESPGYTVYNETILTSPKPEETMIVRGNLRVLPINLTGTISLAVSPPGSEVSIDGVLVGVVPESGILALRTVKYGNRDIRVTKAGYQQYSNDTYVEANMVSKLRISLSPLTTGTLQISSNPPGAQISINGTPYGAAPVTVYDLQQGLYTIGYFREGYLPFVEKVNLTPGQTIPVTGILQPVPTPTPTLATPLYTPSPEPTQSGIPAWLVIFSLLVCLVLVRKK